MGDAVNVWGDPIDGPPECSPERDEMTAPSNCGEWAVTAVIVAVALAIWKRPGRHAHNNRRTT